VAGRRPAVIVREQHNPVIPQTDATAAGETVIG
jgi:hypothetical protein